LRLGKPRPDPVAAQAALLEAMARRADEFDVIHAHIDWLHLPILNRSGVPFLTTLHGRLDLPGLSEMIRLVVQLHFSPEDPAKGDHAVQQDDDDTVKYEWEAQTCAQSGYRCLILSHLDGRKN